MRACRLSLSRDICEGVAGRTLRLRDGTRNQHSLQHQLLFIFVPTFQWQRVTRCVCLIDVEVIKEADRQIGVLKPCKSSAVLQCFASTSYNNRGQALLGFRTRGRLLQLRMWCFVQVSPAGGVNTLLSPAWWALEAAGQTADGAAENYCSRWASVVPECYERGCPAEGFQLRTLHGEAECQG